MMDSSLTPELRATMDAFLASYNPDPERQEEIAIARAIGAAVGHNDLYRKQPLITRAEHQEIRDFWAAELRLRRQWYSASVSEADYEADIEQIKRTMNQRFASGFRSSLDARDDLAPGFRISHAQKGLSVFLKHIWCIDRERFPSPPQCPVDSVIMKQAGAANHPPKWTRINSIEEHREKIALLRGVAERARLPLAHWELLTFSP